MPRASISGRCGFLNDDAVAPGMGFDLHPHREMEIVSIPLSGTLEHKDSMGNVSAITTGEIQVMSAGTGLHHSEYNQSREQNVEFLQIWVFPDREGVNPLRKCRDFRPDPSERGSA